MKVSELISMLEQAKAEHGDLLVFFVRHHWTQGGVQRPGGPDTGGGPSEHTLSLAKIRRSEQYPAQLDVLLS
jgi:hypothetical protein